MSHVNTASGKAEHPQESHNNPSSHATYVFRSPAKLLTGRGCAAQLGSLARELGIRRALVLVDPNVHAIGSATPALESLAAHDVSTALYDGVRTEPVLDYVDAAMTLLTGHGCDGVIAIGGGSVIDTGKAAAALATNGGLLPDYEGVDRFHAPALPLIAVPTTAGTGSEATRVTVVTDPARSVKMMLMADCLLPRAAIDDPLLTLSTPPGPTAAAGLDALTHAIEAYVSRRAQPLTDTLALAAIEQIAWSLPRAWQDGSDLDAREAMMTAQLQAGLAFSNSSVALVHGMARPLGAHFGVPHGLANAMLLPAVMRFSLPGAVTRFARIGDALLASTFSGIKPGNSGEARAERAVTTVEQLSRHLQVPSLEAYGVPSERFHAVKEQMARDALASGSPANNPRPASVEEICALYDKIFQRTT